MLEKNFFSFRTLNFSDEGLKNRFLPHSLHLMRQAKETVSNKQCKVELSFISFPEILNLFVTSTSKWMSLLFLLMGGTEQNPVYLHTGLKPFY